MKGPTRPRRRKKNGRPDPKVLDDIVRRVVEAAQPERIILFGSAARGEMGPDSDIDLLVVKSGKFNHDRVTRNIYRNLSGAAAVDALVVTPEVLEHYGDSPYLVYYPALREGKVIYDTGKKEGHSQNADYTKGGSNATTRAPSHYDREANRRRTHVAEPRRSGPCPRNR